MDVLSQFRSAMAKRGIVPPADIVSNGTIQRCDVEGKNGQRDAAYLLHLDGVPAGGFQNHCDGQGWENWCADMGRKLSSEEKRALGARLRAQRKRHYSREHAAYAINTTARAQAIWSASLPVSGEHRYLTVKRIKDHEIRVFHGVLVIGAMDCAGALVIPMYDASGELSQLQFIGPTGAKRFLPGPRSGLFFTIGEAGKVVCIAEGFATGASVSEATGYAVAIAFGVGNLKVVAKVIRARMPEAAIIVCADDDFKSTGNPGTTKATDAATSVGGSVAKPEFGPDRPDGATDFNDLANHSGLDAVRRCVAAALTPSAVSKSIAGEKSRAISRRMSDVVAQAIKWLWRGRIARGKVTVFAGHPSVGKSQVTASFAATVTTGGVWPDGSRCDIGSVLMVSCEDDAADTIRPRLEAAKADLNRIYILDAIEEKNTEGENVQRSFNLQCDLARLEALLVKLGDVRMISIDPLTAYLGDTDSHKNADMRALFAPLADLASRFGVAVIGVTHLNKAGSRMALLRVSGSLAFVAAARAAYLVVNDNEAVGRRLMLPLKNNIGIDQTGFSFNIEAVNLGEGIETSRVVWDSTPVTVPADDALSSEVPDADEKSAVEEAEEFLREVLSRGGIEATEVYRQADDAGHSKRTIDRAKRKLGIRSVRASFEGAWRWNLPPKIANNGEGSHQKGMAVFDKFGNLRASNMIEVAAGVRGIDEPQIAATTYSKDS